MGSRSFFKFFAVTFSAAGIVSLLIAVIFGAVLLSFRSHALTAQGELVFSPQGGYMVEFTAQNGETYTTNMSYSSSEFYRGQKVKLYYNPDNPYDIQAEETLWFMAIPGGIGLIFFAVGLGSGLPNVLKGFGKKRLIAGGKWVRADIDSVQINPFFTVNRVHPYIILCHFTDFNGRIHRFKSGNIWSKPNAYLHDNSITSLTVFVDGSNYKKYYVDISMFNGE
ncbi:MAG: DUF3592 domain-containing protein [Oscillospiraceae bacterium]|jgi:hypothetical protein|nr:DUF3592 domain-containing protein [Oscillospiraceae bacterium]